MKMRILMKLMCFWPPYFGAGVFVRKISKDFRMIEVEMKLRFWNKNLHGTQFGGSLYSMVDPFFAILLIQNLGPDYVVWDKSASIRFKNPGLGRVRAQMSISEAELERIRNEVNRDGKSSPQFEVVICDLQGKVIAEVSKVLSIKTKRPS